MKAPLADGGRHLWLAAAESAKFSPRPVESVAHWKKFLGSVPLSDGGLLSVPLDKVVCDDVNGTHNCASVSALVLVQGDVAQFYNKARSRMVQHIHCS